VTVHKFCSVPLAIFPNMTKATNYSTSDPGLVYSNLARLATTEAARGADRISVRKLLEQTRAELQVDINNDDAPDFARRLIADYPHLAKLIETRALGKRGKNKARHDVVRDLLDLLARRPDVEIASVTLSIPDEDLATLTVQMPAAQISRVASKLRNRTERIQ
jgi:hypothetical protein